MQKMIERHQVETTQIETMLEFYIVLHLEDYKIRCNFSHLVKIDFIETDLHIV